MRLFILTGKAKTKCLQPLLPVLQAWEAPTGTAAEGFRRKPSISSQHLKKDLLYELSLVIFT